MITSKKDYKEWIEYERSKYDCKRGLLGFINYIWL